MSALALLLCCLVQGGQAATPLPGAAVWGGFLDGSRFLHRQGAVDLSGRDAARRDSLHAWDALAYQVALRLQLSPAWLDATVEIEAVAREDLGALDLQLRGYAITTAQVNGLDVSLSRLDDQLSLDLGAHPLAAGDSARILLAYGGTPVAQAGVGLFVSPQIAYTLSDPWGTRNWIACFDEPFDKALWSVSVRADSTLTTLSNGALLSVENHGDGTSTWSYAHDRPMSSYLVSLVTGHLTILEDSWQGLPLRWCVYPQHVAPAWEAVSRAGQMFDCFTGLWGDYPFASYAMGEAPIYGGMGAMEHQTCTTVGNGIIAGGLQYESIIAHELSHMWWGDAVTPVDFRHVWLNEGWATYAEALYFQYLAGGDEQAFLDYLRQIHQTYLGWDSQFLPIYDPPVNDLFNTSQYEKAASVLHMLRDLMGDAAFLQAQRDWQAARRYGTVDTPDYQAALEAAGGLDLTEFFQQWIYSGGYPTYQTVTESRAQGDSCRVHLTVGQSHQVLDSFRARVPLRIVTDQAQLDTLVWIEAPSTQLGWTLPGTFDTLIFNHRETVLCRHLVVPPVTGPPQWRMSGFAIDDSTGGNGDGDLARDESGWLSLELRNVGGWDTGIQFSLDSPDLEVSGTWAIVDEAGGGATVLLPTGVVQLSGWDGADMDYADLVLHSVSDHFGEQAAAIRLPMGDPWLILATSQSQEDLRPFYQIPLDSLRIFTDGMIVDADQLPPEGLPEATGLLWFSGDSGQRLTPDQQAWLKQSYEIFWTKTLVTGQDAWDDPVADCLFQPITLDVNEVLVDGVPGSPFQGLTALLIGAGGAGNQTSPSSLALCPEVGSCGEWVLAVYHNSQEPALLGVGFCDVDYSLFAAGFGFEAISGMAGTSSREAWLAAAAELLFTDTALRPASLPERPLGFWLGMPHPNPFNPVARIPYELSRAMPIRLSLHDLLGREVRVLAEGRQAAGANELSLEGSGLAAGLYIVTLKTEGRHVSRKVLLLK